MDNTTIILSNASSSVLDYELYNGSNNGNGTQWADDIGWSGVYPSGYSHLGIILTSFFVTAIMIVIVVGNMLVCIAIATEKALKTVQNWFIASLAVSDFLVGLVVMPFSLAKELMGYWIFGRVWCEVHSALDVFLCTASINSLCLISLDRYWSVTRAVEYLRKRTPRRSMIMIVGVWVLSAVISLPPLVGWKKPQRHLAPYPECLLSDDVGYVLYSAFGSFYVPAFIMVFVYARIFVAARSRARRHLKKRQKATGTELTTTSKDKSTTTTTTTCTSFSNASPPSPKGVSLLSGIPESNGAPGPPPTIIIQGDEASMLRAPKYSNDDDDEEEEEDIKTVSVTFQEETDRLSVQQKEGTRRTSLLRAPKFLRSPFGSTLSLAESEDEITTKKKKKKKKQQQAPVVEVQQPVVVVAARPTDAERQRRRVAKAKERRATLILGLIMASFILAWLPFFVLYVLEALCTACNIGPTGFAVAFWLGYCNSALNPIIYTIFNRDFRRAFRKILFK